MTEETLYMKGLEERVGKHSKDMERGFEKVFERLDVIQLGQQDLRVKMAEERLLTYQQIQEVKDKVTAVEKAATEKSHKLDLKIVAIAAAIGMFGGGAGSEIMYRIRPSVPPQERTTIKLETSTPTESK